MLVPFSAVYILSRINIYVKGKWKQGDAFSIKLDFKKYMQRSKIFATYL